MNILQKIFTDHYEEMLYILHPRHVVIENVGRMIHCGAPYYGLYVRHRENDQSLYKAIHRSKHRIIRSFTKWRTDILLSFGYDPLHCPKCRHEMLLAELYYDH